MDWEDLDLTSIIVPDGFHWGVATAAHQIEGGLRNNWTTFETSSGMEQSGQACDHWNLWKQDFQLISDLGLTTYRFSIEWSRLEPEKGFGKRGHFTNTPEWWTTFYPRDKTNDYAPSFLPP